MAIKWINEKCELNRLINIEHVSYEEIGRRYGCSGSNIRKVAYRYGIDMPSRRLINPIEKDKRKKPKMGKCLNCGKDIILYTSTGGKYCSPNCQCEYQYKKYIERWKNGEESGVIGKYDMSKYVRKYMLEKAGNKCEKCGWNKVNPATGKIPLQIHHIDGDCTNNKEENLQVLCPNCHSLTENFGSRNKNATIGRTEYYTSQYKKKKYENNIE